MKKKNIAIGGAIAALAILLGVWIYNGYDKRPDFAKSEMTITRADGAKFTYEVEVAATAEEQSHGLMFVRSLPENQGMIFVNTPPREAAFWMKDTYIPLDMLFVGDDHKIIRVVEQARPLDTTPLFSNGPVIAVVEINAGQVKKNGLALGDSVDSPALTTAP